MPIGVYINLICSILCFPRASKILNVKSVLTRLFNLAVKFFNIIITRTYISGDNSPHNKAMSKNGLSVISSQPMYPNFHVLEISVLYLLRSYLKILYYLYGSLSG